MGFNMSTERTISKEDIAAIVGHLIELNRDQGLAEQYVVCWQYVLLIGPRPRRRGRW